MLAGSCETFGPVVALHRYSHRRRGGRARQRHRLRPQRLGLGHGPQGRRPRWRRRIESGNVNVNDSLAAAYASKGTPSGGVKQSGVGARHGDQGLLKYTDVQNLAVLKKQVMGAQPGQDYDAYVKQMLMSLKIMRKTDPLIASPS